VFIGRIGYMWRPLQFAGLVGCFVLASCADSSLLPAGLGGASPQPAATVPSVDAGTALGEARRCGRAIAVAARCNYLRDDRDVAALRFSVLQGLDQRFGGVVDQPRMTEAVDLAMLDRMATIGQCTVSSADVPVLEGGLREVLGSCSAP
jgi:hypothetical protein